LDTQSPSNKQTDTTLDHNHNGASHQTHNPAQTPVIFGLERMSGMPRRYPAQVRDRAIKMVLSHLDEYDSVYQAAFAIGPKVGVKGESLRRWVQTQLDEGTPEGIAQVEKQTESTRIKELERKVRDLEEANEILKAASIFFAGELDPGQQRK
ncbi:MAG: hypothetical protein LBG99_09495, partial [Propionibacteriaceae bacterium]|nr:hypothetical protein [Propionibacteriaceae bacterium]